MRPGAGAGPARGWAEVDRFVLSGPGGPAPRFLFEHLFPPHGRRERWLRQAASRSAAVARRALAPAGAAARRAGEELERVLRALELAPWSEWILSRPHGADRRGRSTAFLFPPAADLPNRVVKLRQPEGEGGGLAAEARVLEQLAGALPEALRGTLPAVLHHGFVAEREALVLTRLPGRSGYVELQGSLAPVRLLPRHFRGAGAWLARFHRATLRLDGPWRPQPWEALAPEPGEARPEWHRRLETELRAAPLPGAAAHGDFWVRNLLLVREGAPDALPGVVDWEHHRPEAPPFEDLFHFAWSYALAYPWQGRRRGPEESFDRAFLRDTALSREVRRYLAEHAREAGTDAGVLGELFRVFLLTRARGEGGAWIRLYRRLEAAGRSVFSG